MDDLLNAIAWVSQQANRPSAAERKARDEAARLRWDLARHKRLLREARKRIRELEAPAGRQALAEAERADD